MHPRMKTERKEPPSRLSIPQPIIFHGPALLLHHQTASFPPRPRSLASTRVLISATHITGGCPYKIRYGSDSSPTLVPQLCWGPTDMRPSARRVLAEGASKTGRTPFSWKRCSPGTHNKSCSVLFCSTWKLRLCGSSHTAWASRQAPKHFAVKCIAAELEIGCY